MAKPTKAERIRFEKMMELGCVACAHLHIWHVAHHAHHLLSGNRRMGHVWTIPLCAGHHIGTFSFEQSMVIPKEKLVSIAHGRKEFVKYYPDERTLWEQVQRRLKLSLTWPESKILKRTV